MTEGYQAGAEHIRHAYARRDGCGKSELYSWYRPDVLLAQFTLHHVVARLFEMNGLACLDDIEVLDVGCGSGGWLCRLLDWGARPEKLHGIDLLPDRIEAAKQRAPHVDFRVVNGEVPYPDDSMDLVCASTVFSSILDADARMELANEMRRVLRKEGAILIYDFCISHPRNLDTTGIGKREIHRLFSRMECMMHSVTLAPPLSRPIAKVSSWLAYTLERMVPLLRTHAVFLLRDLSKEEI